MRRYAVLGGIAGPALFAAVVVLCGALRPEYDHVTQFISELGETEGDYAPLMNYLGFMMPAALIMSFAAALRAKFPPTSSSIVGSGLVGIFAAGMFAAGAFSCDPTCTPVLPSAEQRLHDLASRVAFPSLILATLVWGFFFLRIPEWRRFGFYSLATGVVSVGLLVSMVSSVEARSGTGLLQRFLLGGLFLWPVLLAGRLWHQAATSELECTAA